MLLGGDVLDKDAVIRAIGLPQAAPRPLAGTGHRSHAWQGQMIDRYIRWHNARA